MDTFTVMLGITTFVSWAIGEWKSVGAYLWIAALFMILFAFRMGEFGFYIVSAGAVVTLLVRTQHLNADVVEED